ncbi:hypothetical protein CPB84DRAFT_1755304 [Gymnopilus junonius]|uniref:Uncharacterized protein n=1 Tax=Gymnopilus junonius TaxID=109634 RepID=A0A9P5N6Q0_GYMJU|nr:hypothetical protein CPB84DRAFT_1755304 [Gymnopilus junonius]
MRKAPPEVQELWAIRIGDAIPRALFFFGGTHQSLLTLCLENAQMSCREAQNHNLLWRKALSGGIGNAALLSDEKVLLVDNLSTGSFDIYEIPSQTLLRSFQPASTRRYVKQCTFLESARTAVCGSTNNEVRVMDVMNGECLQLLKTATKDDMMQVIAVSTAHANRHLIAGGSGSTPTVYLWEKLKEIEWGKEFIESHNFSI